jgi:type IV secretion system protein VirB5
MTIWRGNLIAGAVAIWGAGAMAQGVPTIDTRNLLQQIQVYEQLLEDAGIQTDQLGQLTEQVRLLDQQLSKLRDVEALLKDPTQVLSLALGPDLDGLLNGKFDLEMVGTILRGARGDWSGLGEGASERLQGLIGDVFISAGTSQEAISDMAESGDPRRARNATQSASNAATSAAAQVAYEEATTSVRRVERLVTEIANMDTLKKSVDHNTRVTAELAVAMAALWQLESVQTMNVGLMGVADAATLAEIEKFTDFTAPDLTPASGE